MPGQDVVFEALGRFGTVSPLIPEGLESRGSSGSECGIDVLPRSSPPWTLGRPVATAASCGLSIWQMNEQSHGLCPSV